MQRASGSWCSHQAFTLIELIVVLAIITALAGLLMPVLAMARQRGVEKTCVSNLRQIGLGMIGYADDFSGWYPLDGMGANEVRVPSHLPHTPYGNPVQGFHTLCTAYAQYGVSLSLLRCPGDQ